jgi:hypothetical protein
LALSRGQPGISSTKPVSETILSLRFQSRSRILSLPSSETTIRGYSPQLVLLDEAACVPDSLVYAVLLMLAAAGGRLVGLSTPNGRSGWFYNVWTSTEPYMRVKVTAHECAASVPNTSGGEEDNAGHPVRPRIHGELRRDDILGVPLHTTIGSQRQPSKASSRRNRP